jgi:hypothetical protein
VSHLPKFGGKFLQFLSTSLKNHIFFFLVISRAGCSIVTSGTLSEGRKTIVELGAIMKGGMTLCHIAIGTIQIIHYDYIGIGKMR